MHEMNTIHWNTLAFNALSGLQVHAILALRQSVFILEQHCFYPDIDEYDSQAIHIMGSDHSETTSPILATYARLLPPHTRFTETSIGRVVTHPDYRLQSLGRQLMHYSLRCAERYYPSQAIRISAQCYLQPFYNSMGFQTISAPYDEDGIMHIEMIKPY
jgi:ElaA protein